MLLLSIKNSCYVRVVLSHDCSYILSIPVFTLVFKFISSKFDSVLLCIIRLSSFHVTGNIIHLLEQKTIFKNFQLPNYMMEYFLVLNKRSLSQIL
jgi:hypothetical protein